MKVTALGSQCEKAPLKMSCNDDEKEEDPFPLCGKIMQKCCSKCIYNYL